MLNRVASSETQIIVNSFIEAIDPIGITHDTFSDVYTDVHIAPKNLINCIAYFSNLNMILLWWLCRNHGLKIWRRMSFLLMGIYMFMIIGGNVSLFMNEGIE